jgi:hypothetical protein
MEQADRAEGASVRVHDARHAKQDDEGRATAQPAANTLQERHVQMKSSWAGESSNRSGFAAAAIRACHAVVQATVRHVVLTLMQRAGSGSDDGRGFSGESLNNRLCLSA